MPKSLIALLMALVLLTISACTTVVHPPRPRPFKRPVIVGKVWIPGHFSMHGVWIHGHWRRH